MGALALPAGIGAASFVLALVLRKKSAMPKIVPWLMLAAGWLVGGLLGNLLAKLGGWAVSLTAESTSRLFGVGLPALLVIVIAIVLFVDMKPKGSPGKITPWLALLFGPLLAATGGAMAQMHGAGSELFVSLGQAIVGLFPGA